MDSDALIKPRIFFEHEQNKLKDPFTEREMQQLYRERKLSPTTLVYFSIGDRPDETTPSYSLLELRNICGIGCPFMDPATLPKTLGRTATAEEIKLKHVQFALAGIRAANSDLDVLVKEADVVLWRTESISLRRVGGTQSKKKKKNRKKKVKSVSTPQNEERTVDCSELSREERLERLAREFSALRSLLFAALSLKREVRLLLDQSKQHMIEAMRMSAEKVVRTSALPVEDETITEASLIEAMNTIVVEHVSIASYGKPPDKPRGCSRAAWLQHVKMAKRFANAIYQVCVGMNTGCCKTIDGNAVCETMTSAGDWAEKWEHGPLNVQLAQLVDHEIVKRIKELEYFFCYHCMLVHFDVQQTLSHFSHGDHNLKTREIAEEYEDDVGEMTILLATTTLQVVSRLPKEIHDTHTTEFTLPLLKSGMRVPPARPHSLPSKAFLEEINTKYASINGEYDEQKMEADPVYAASILKEVISRHKSELGRQLFAELDEYFRKGENFYCARCCWLLTSRARYYRHLRNSIHVACVTNLSDGVKMSFDLVTFSVNIHAAADD